MKRSLSNRRSQPPEGFEEIADKLREFETEMRSAERASHFGKRKVEAAWEIYKLHHRRSRYIYDLYHKDHAITKELYDYLLRVKTGDELLIAKWKKQGYENLCCLLCIATANTNFGTVCLCRVPKAKLDSNTFFQCNNCGCRGCASCD